MTAAKDNSVIAKRLVQTRLALGYKTQSAFAEQLGTHSAQYSVFESGRRRISLGVALLISEKFGISLDWIYCGDAVGLPASVYKKLRRRRSPD